MSATPQPWPAREVAVVLPIGGFWVRWHDPTEDEVTLWKVEWDQGEVGSEEEVWRAVEVLAGGPVLLAGGPVRP